MSQKLPAESFFLPAKRNKTLEKKNTGATFNPLKFYDENLFKNEREKEIKQISRSKCLFF